METYMDEDEGLVDFYNTYDPYEVTKKDLDRYKRFMNSLNDEEKKLIEANEYYYELSFSNLGGLVMPLILEFNFTNGSSEMIKIPAEIWRKNNENITKIFGFNKEVESIVLDPFLETADTDINNNSWPAIYHPSRFEVFKYKNRRDRGDQNPMKESKKK